MLTQLKSTFLEVSLDAKRSDTYILYFFFYNIRTKCQREMSAFRNENVKRERGKISVCVMLNLQPVMMCVFVWCRE